MREKPAILLQSQPSDGKGGTASANVTISITDIDERPIIETPTPISEQPENSAPVFTEGSSTTRSIAENTDSGINIGSPIDATDAEGDALFYSLSDTDANAFSLDSSFGQLQTKASLDYEAQSIYSVTITADDGNGGSASITVTINITDIDEQLVIETPDPVSEQPANRAPVFTAGSSTTRSVDENTASNVNIGTPVAATDADDDTLTYSLGGNDAAAFSINSSTGQLKTNAALNYEEKNSYSVTITANDGNGGSATITVTISITDINEQPVIRTPAPVSEQPANRAPVFTAGSSTTRSVDENTASNVNIGTPVAATDADDDTLTYSLGGNDAAAFSINSSTGQLKTNAALNYEEKNSYSVTITANDGNGGSATITVTISITDINEQPVIRTPAPVSEQPANRAPVFTAGSSTTRSVDENTASNVNIGTPVAATDADDDTLTYSLGGNDAASFSINSSTGQLKTNAALNYEEKNSYSVTITANDQNGGTASIAVTVSVTNVNEAPVFTDGSSATRSVVEYTESSQNIGTPVAATDADNDTLTYSLGGTDADSFSINSTTGQLLTDDVLAYQTKSSYSVTITATDGNGGSATIDVTISVVPADNQELLGGQGGHGGDVTNSAPVFTDGSSTTRSIDENTANNVNIGTPVAATDADDDTLTYSLSGTDATSFSISSTDGQLKTSAALDYEEKSSHSVIVTATDAKGASASITVTISVIDIVEIVFTDGSSTTRSVAENTNTDTYIGTPVSATHPNGNTLTYSLGGTDAGSFRIRSTTGQLEVYAALDYETKSSYSVTVTATDTDGNSASIPVTISVNNLNDNAPVFTDGDSTSRAIGMNRPRNTAIGSPVSATDADGDTLTYSLSGTHASKLVLIAIPDS